MAITLKDLTMEVTADDRRELLGDWQWLTGDAKVPILLTASGDAFLQDLDDGTIHMLDTGAGELFQVASTLDHLRTLLRNPEFVSSHLAPEMIADLRLTGKVLGPRQTYSLKVPLPLGGDYTLDNIEPTDLAVHFALAGQIHRQVKNLPDGTRVNARIADLRGPTSAAADQPPAGG